MLPSEEAALRLGDQGLDALCLREPGAARIPPGARRPEEPLRPGRHRATGQPSARRASGGEPSGHHYDRGDPAAPGRPVLPGPSRHRARRGHDVRGGRSPAVGGRSRGRERGELAGARPWRVPSGPDVRSHALGPRHVRGRRPVTGRPATGRGGQGGPPGHCRLDRGRGGPVTIRPPVLTPSIALRLAPFVWVGGGGDHYGLSEAAVNAALVLMADHELATSTVAASASRRRPGPTLYDALLAGLATMAGPLHRGGQPTGL